MNSQERILVIRHGALGDVVLSTGPFAAIRRHHPAAHITLLTTPPYAKLLKDSPYFDEVTLDEKPGWLQRGKVKKLKRFFADGTFKRVYDLQTSQRSTWYYRLLPNPKPEFSGLARGASHRHKTPERTKLHTIDRQKQQLAVAGIENVPLPDVSWLKPAESRFNLSQYCLLVPGGSVHRPEKRWPREHFAELGTWLCGQGIQPVLLGTQAEADILDWIVLRLAMPDARVYPLNLCNKTNFADIAALARGAQFAVGNDTGPMHLIAAAGCPSVALFNTTASNPDLCAPRGKVKILQGTNLTDISPADVTAALTELTR